MADERDLRVLIVEDDPMTAEAHADFVRRVPGFVVAGTCLSGHEALEKFEAFGVSGEPVDIVLLDMNLTDSHGLDVAKRMNAKGYGADIIAITAVRHLQVIRSAISSGVTQYLIKPFTFTIFREKLENQRDFRLNLDGAGAGSLATQASVDNALSALRSVSSGRLPKGLIEETLTAISGVVRECFLACLGDRGGHDLGALAGHGAPVPGASGEDEAGGQAATARDAGAA